VGLRAASNYLRKTPSHVIGNGDETLLRD
jgi:hypothetical protein